MSTKTYLIFIFSLTGLSIVIGIAIKYAQRNKTQAEYAQLDRVGDISLEPFVSNDQLGRDALLGSSSSSSNQELNNQTDSTLIPPPSNTQESALNYDNQAYKSQSSSGLSTDTGEFQSLNETVTENQSAVSPENNLSPPAASSTMSHGLPTPTIQEMQISNDSPAPVLPEPLDPSSPIQSSPQSSSTPIVDRIKNMARNKQRKRTSKSDPTRVLPKRAAKKNINYKE